MAIPGDTTIISKNKTKIITLLLLAAVCLTAPSGAEEDVNVLIDDFYAGLAKIIERNMDDPETCLAKVDKYYEDNGETVERAQNLMKEGLSKTKKLMGEYKEKYKAMTNEQFSAYLAKDRVRLETEAAERKAAREERQSPGAARYNKAIEEFTMKHPMKGIKVTMKAMKLLPKNFGTTADAKQK